MAYFYYGYYPIFPIVFGIIGVLFLCGTCAACVIFGKNINKRRDADALMNADNRSLQRETIYYEDGYGGLRNANAPRGDVPSPSREESGAEAIPGQALQPTIKSDEAQQDVDKIDKTSKPVTVAENPNTIVTTQDPTTTRPPVFPIAEI